MKRSMFPVLVNGNKLQPDQFGWVAKRSGEGFCQEGIDAITFVCPNGKKQCLLQVKLGGPEWPRFGWDGNMEAPTLTPSVGCDHRCGWHGHIANGIWSN